MNDLYFIPVMSILGLSLLFVGLRIISTKKPFIVISTYPLILLLILYIPLMILPLIIDYIQGDIDYFTSSLILLFFIVIVMYMKKVLHGYQVIGINEDDFHKCLSTSLDNLKIDYEEKFNKIDLINNNLVIHCSMQSWIGQAQIQFKGNKNKNLIKSILKEFKNHLISNEVVLNNTSAFFYTIIGILTVTIAIYYIINI